MKRIFFVPALAALTLLGLSSNAKGNKTADAKTTDAVAATSKSEAKNGAGTTYWITGETTINGQPAYTFNQVEQDCVGDGNACQFTTTSGTLASPQLQSKIEGEQGVTVDTRHD